MKEPLERRLRVLSGLGDESPRVRRPGRPRPVAAKEGGIAHQRLLLEGAESWLDYVRDSAASIEGPDDAVGWRKLAGATGMALGAVVAAAEAANAQLRRDLADARGESAT